MPKTLYVWIAVAFTVVSLALIGRWALRDLERIAVRRTGAEDPRPVGVSPRRGGSASAA